MTDILKDVNLWSILGSHRSGTTVLTLALNAHPKILAIDEIGDATHHAPADYLRKEHLLKELRDEVVGTYDAVVFKMPFYVPRQKYLAEHWPNAQYILLQRDPRAVVRSLLAMQDGQWIAATGELQLIRVIEALDDLEEKKYLQAKYDAEKDDPNVLPALLWRAKHSLIKKYRQSAPHVDITYENFTMRPEHELKRLLAHMKVEWDAAVLTHHLAAQDDGYGCAAGGTPKDRAIDTRSIALWKDELSDQAVGKITEICSEQMREAGY